VVIAATNCVLILLQEIALHLDAKSMGICDAYYSMLLYPQRLERGVSGVGIETGLELGEKFTGDGGDVADAGHREQDAFGTGIEGDLEGLGEVLDGYDVAAEAHAPQHDHLTLDWLAQYP
jgi:hypothetical protein